jgi:hypothetical protein
MASSGRSIGSVKKELGQRSVLWRWLNEHGVGEPMEALGSGFTKRYWRVVVFSLKGTRCWTFVRRVSFRQQETLRRVHANLRRPWRQPRPDDTQARNPLHHGIAVHSAKSHHDLLIAPARKLADLARRYFTSPPQTAPHHPARAALSSEAQYFYGKCEGGPCIFGNNESPAG